MAPYMLELASFSINKKCPLEIQNDTIVILDLIVQCQSNQTKSNQIKSNEIEPNHIESNQIKSTQSEPNRMIFS